MHSHFILNKLRLATAFLAGVALIFSLPTQAQDQDTSKKMDDLRREISFLNSRVCGAGAAQDSVADMRKQTLAADAKALTALLDQQKAKLTGVDLDTARDKQRIDDEEKALAQPCPGLPVELQNLLNAAGPAPAAAVATAPLPQVTVTPSGGLDFDPLTIGTRSDAKSVSVTNNSPNDLDMFVWYGTHLTNFNVSDNTCDTITPPKGTCAFKVTFAPMELHSPEARLRVVRRSDWKEFEKVRLAYKEQGQAAIDEASYQIDELRKNLKGGSAQNGQTALWFCEHFPAIKGKDRDQLQEACNNLKAAAAKSKEIENKLPAGTKVITQTEVNAAANALRDKALAVIPLSGTANHWKYPLTRGVVGLDMSAVSSQTVKQAYFVDFDLLAPFKLPGMKSNEDALESPLWFWLNPRITSLPQATNFSALSTIDASGTFFTNFSNKGSVSDIAQGFDVNGGLEIALLKPRDGIPWWGEYVNAQARLSASLIVGAGISTPFSVDNTDVPSQVNQSICDAFKAPAGTTVSGPSGLVCTFAAGGTNPVITAPNPAFDPTNPMSPATVQDQFVDFFTPERSRFFRRYYAGFRLKTYFFSPDVKGDCNPKRKRCDAPYDIFPGIIDVTAGQDEAVTAGRLKNIIFRIEGVYPLPFVPGLHIFGSIYSSFKGNHADFPLNSFNVNTPAEGARNDLNTFRFGLPPLNRDYFRVGIGIDLIQVFKRNKGGQPTTNTAAPPTQGDSGATPPASGK